VAGPGPKQASAYRREAGQWLIEIRLRELRQLFHHLDPAPFREKDLDPAAEEYIEDAVREIGTRQPARLVIHLPPGSASATRRARCPMRSRTTSSTVGARRGSSCSACCAVRSRTSSSDCCFLAACLSLHGSVEALAPAH